MLAAIVAVICANSGLAHLYEELLHLHPLAWIPGVNRLGMNLSLLHLTNDGLMAVFFFLRRLRTETRNHGRRAIRQA